MLFPEIMPQFLDMVVPEPSYEKSSPFIYLYRGTLGRLRDLLDYIPPVMDAYIAFFKALLS